MVKKIRTGIPFALPSQKKQPTFLQTAYDTYISKPVKAAGDVVGQINSASDNFQGMIQSADRIQRGTWSQLPESVGSFVKNSVMGIKNTADIGSSALKFASTFVPHAKLLAGVTGALGAGYWAYKKWKNSKIKKLKDEGNLGIGKIAQMSHDMWSKAPEAGRKFGSGVLRRGYQIADVANRVSGGQLGRSINQRFQRYGGRLMGEDNFKRAKQMYQNRNTPSFVQNISVQLPDSSSFTKVQNRNIEGNRQQQIQKLQIQANNLNSRTPFIRVQQDRMPNERDLGKLSNNNVKQTIRRKGTKTDMFDPISIAAMIGPSLLKTGVSLFSQWSQKRQRQKSQKQRRQQMLQQDQDDNQEYDGMPHKRYHQQ